MHGRVQDGEAYLQAPASDETAIRFDTEKLNAVSVSGRRDATGTRQWVPLPRFPL